MLVFLIMCLLYQRLSLFFLRDKRNIRYRALGNTGRVLMMKGKYNRALDMWVPPSDGNDVVNSMSLYISLLLALFRSSMQVHQKSTTLYHTPGDGLFVPRDRKLFPDAEQFSQLQRSRSQVAKSRRGVWERTATAPGMRISGVGRR